MEALSLNEKISIAYTCTIYFFLLFAYLFLKKIHVFVNCLVKCLTRQIASLS